MSASGAAARGFDPTGLERDGNRLSTKLALWLVTRPIVLAAARRFARVGRLGGITWITRYDDVMEALSHPETFRVPFGAKMKHLVPTSCPFILGVDGGEAYWRGLKAIMPSFPLGELDRVRQISAATAEKIVEASPDRLEAITGLMTAVPVRVCQEYYGLDIAQPKQFGVWLMAMSNYTFRKIGIDPVAEHAASAAAPLVMAIVDGAIAAAKAGHKRGTVVGHFVQLQRDAQAGGCAAMDDTMLRSTIIGMTIGFVATATMASGHILEVLLRRKDAMSMCTQAAIAGDDDLLGRCLMEALRFYPINLGPWRICAEDYTFAKPTWQRSSVRKGAKVLVVTQSAMHDPRFVVKPGTFNPDRPTSDSFVFGKGLHWCVGAPLAIAQMTETFKPLLRRRPVRRAKGEAGRTRYFGAFPERLTVTLGSRN